MHNTFNRKVHIENILSKIYYGKNYDIKYKNISFYIGDHFYKGSYLTIIDSHVIKENKEVITAIKKEKKN